MIDLREKHECFDCKEFLVDIHRRSPFICRLLNKHFFTYKKLKDCPLSESESVPAIKKDTVCHNKWCFFFNDNHEDRYTPERQCENGREGFPGVCKLRKKYDEKILKRVKGNKK